MCCIIQRSAVTSTITYSIIAVIFKLNNRFGINKTVQTQAEKWRLFTGTTRELQKDKNINESVNWQFTLKLMYEVSGLYSKNAAYFSPNPWCWYLKDCTLAPNSTRLARFWTDLATRVSVLPAVAEGGSTRTRKTQNQSLAHFTEALRATHYLHNHKYCDRLAVEILEDKPS